MFKKKKLLYSLAIPLSLGVVAFAISCSSTNVLQNSHQRRELVYRNNVNADSYKFYDFTIENRWPSSSDTTSEWKGTHLFVEAGSGKAELDRAGKVTSYQNLWIEKGLGEAVYITKKDGTVVVYDNDKHEIVPQTGSRFGFKTLTSADPKSINNPKFYEDLKDAKKVQMTVKEGIHWVNTKGEKTKYTVKAEDFYFNHLLDSKYRYANNRRSSGGSKEIDDTLVNKNNPNIDPHNTYFSDGSYPPNDYLYELFGVNKTKLDTKEGYLTSVTNGAKTETAVTVESQEESTDFSVFFKELIAGSTLFQATPSDYIKELAEAENPTVEGKKPSGEVAESGVYWYGKDWQKMLFASPYYAKQVSQSQYIWEQNPHFYNQEWVKSDTSIKRIIIEIYTGLDPSAFANQQFENYKRNYTANLAYSTLNKAQQDEINANPSAFNLSYVIDPQWNSLPSSYLRYSPAPAPKKAESDAKPNYLFNDGYAYAMYGASTDQLAAAGEKSVSTNKHFWLGHGLTFRTLLSSAFNIYTYVKTKAPNNQIPWNAMATADNKISGSDWATDSKQTLFDYKNEVDKSFAINLEGKKFAEKTVAEDEAIYKDPNNQGNSKTLWESKTYNEIKAEMKKLLDKIYEQFKLDASTKVEWKLQEWTKSSSTAISAANGVVEIINSLDDRLSVSLPEDQSNARTNIIDGIATETRTGWGYDYDGIGSYLSALAYPPSGLSAPPTFQVFTLFADLESENPELAKSFPEMVLLSKALKEDKKLWPDGVATFDEIKNASTWNLIHNRKEFINKSNKTFDLITEWLKFFFTYQSKRTNKQLVDLQNELHILSGWNPMSTQGLVNDPASPSVLLQSAHYSLPKKESGYNLRGDFAKVYPTESARGK
ncbi:hypothetical protein NV226_03095 [Mycoplasma iguanae]|uniref:Lipoprotein n=1 Tax=Mycoplasma iguanae TaxID=292461 RepID=A0ABY5RBU7_9MOLU|nr:hypothetical protein [Mycoplasma iguanae]UVD81685.1 hypothetical protein NV226_03095 [Mycoplasma iguanae]